MVPGSALGSGTPTTPTTPTTPSATAIPADVQGSLTSFAYDPAAQSLTISGISFDEEDITAPYRRRTALDITAADGRVAYEAYTAQDDPLDEHTTAYIKSISDVTAAVAVTGGQFTYYDGGSLFTRTGAYDPVTVSEPGDTGLVSYAGSYIGMSNVNGVNTDLTPTVGTPPADILPYQASTVNGSIFINVDFVQNRIKGLIYRRTLTVPNAITGAPVLENVPNLILVPTDVASDGTFTAAVQISPFTDVGNYAGVLGGSDSEAIAGSLYADNHFNDLRGGEEEYGIFVLGKCGAATSNDPALCASGAAE